MKVYTTTKDGREILIIQGDTKYLALDLAGPLPSAAEIQNEIDAL